ncbi:Cro/CI family transcriptional regulator [Morganella morganii]|uniref:Cro/CI family transcriptional regulator n=1 Tax=Morganella morganii TaxID=582 RepID=UPI000467F4C4|nr:Cro/CI family transcriptional regulator [Morganella morganii]
MHKNQVLAYFGGTTKTALILGISHSAVCQWVSIVPEKQALKIERLTNGKLKYNPALYQHSSTEKHG